MIDGYYYLHTNGQLIYKKDLDGLVADLRESPFVRAMWPVDPADRETCWRILVEGFAAGADPERIKNLADRWKCDDLDAGVYASRLGLVLKYDGDEWMAGFHWSGGSFFRGGPTALEAMGELCKALGYEPSVMWGSTFAHLIKQKQKG